MSYNERPFSDDEKDSIISDYEMKQKKLYRRGKLIVTTIAISNVVIEILGSVFVSFNVIQLIVQIAFSIALYWGVRWVRWLFVIGSALNVFFALQMLYFFIDIGESIPILLGVILILDVVYAVGTGVLLIFSKSVSEFLYGQRT